MTSAAHEPTIRRPRSLRAAVRELRATGAGVAGPWVRPFNHYYHVPPTNYHRMPDIARVRYSAVCRLVWPRSVPANPEPDVGVMARAKTKDLTKEA